MAENHRWNPWRALRDRHWLTLEWVRFERCHGQLVEDGDGRRRIQLDHRLGRRERSAVLTHELVHDERGILGDDAPPGVVQKEEHWVRTITAERLVPRAALRAYIDRQDGGGVTAQMVASEFDVTVGVASLALRLLQAADDGRPSHQYQF